MIHSTTILGGLGKDAEVRKAGDKFVLAYSIASTLRWKVGQEQREKTFWTDCDQWFDKEESANRLASFLLKGSKVIVVGQSYASAYINKDGIAVGSLSLRVEKLEIVNSTKPKENGSSQTAPPVYTNNAGDDDDNDGLPF